MSFSEVAGHEGPVSRLRAALRNGRLAHGYIFAGPEGVGKTLTATQFAKAVLCEEMVDDACGQCVSCRKFAHGNHPGFERIGTTGAGRYIRVEALREFQQRLAYGTGGSDHLVVLIEPADRMRPAGANAFLKTLEEPPPGVVMILITARPASLLDTIISRCQTVRFAPLPRDQIERALIESHGASPETAAPAAAMSDGSPGHAVELLGDDVIARRDTVFDHVMALQPITSPDVVDAMMKQIRDDSSNAAQRREATIELLTLMLYLFRDILVVTTAGEEYPLYNADRPADVRQAVDDFIQADVLKLVEMTTDAIAMVEGNANIQMLLDDLLGRIARFKTSRPAASSS